MLTSLGEIKKKKISEFKISFERAVLSLVISPRKKKTAAVFHVVSLWIWGFYYSKNKLELYSIQLFADVPFDIF